MKVSCSTTQIPDKGPVESNFPARGMRVTGIFFTAKGFNAKLAPHLLCVDFAPLR